MLTLALCFLPLSTPILTDDAAPKPTPEMKPIEFLVGAWKGTGWVQTREGKQEFTINEKVESKLNGSVFLVEGIGKASDGHIAHHALAFFHFDKQKNEFRIKAFRKDGGYVDAKGEMKEGKFIWGFDQPQAGKVRFTLHLNDRNQWVEIGEFSRDGNQWMKFMEMTLDKVTPRGGL